VALCSALVTLFTNERTVETTCDREFGVKETFSIEKKSSQVSLASVSNAKSNKFTTLVQI
jgi:hypothetical protein